MKGGAGDSKKERGEMGTKAMCNATILFEPVTVITQVMSSKRELSKCILRGEGMFFTCLHDEKRK